MEIKIKKLRDDATIPTCGSKYSAGMDLYSCSNAPIQINPHETYKVETGLAIEIPEGYFGGVFARSGLSTKMGLRPSNCTGVIDSDYRGDIIVALHNDSDCPRMILPNERIAQLIILPFLPIEFKEVDELSDTDRADKGFGSTGK